MFVDSTRVSKGGTGDAADAQLFGLFGYQRWKYQYRSRCLGVCAAAQLLKLGEPKQSLHRQTQL